MATCEYCLRQAVCIYTHYGYEHIICGAHLPVQTYLRDRIEWLKEGIYPPIQ